MATETSPVPGSPRGTRVLLVDDELSSAEVLALILAGEGYDVTLAPDARQALARALESPPQVLLTDFMMPGMNGAELVKALRGQEAFRELPVILMSGAPEAALRSYGVAYQAFLRKPFGLEKLLAVLQSVLPPR